MNRIHPGHFGGALTLAATLYCLTLHADALSQWRWIAPAPTGNNLNAVAFAKGLFVAGGEFGTVLTSPDGQSWEPQFSGIEQHITAIAYGNGTFVASAIDAASGQLLLLSSANGTNWLKHSIPIRGFEGYIAFAGSQFFAVAPYFDDLQQRTLTEVFLSLDGSLWRSGPNVTLPGVFRRPFHADNTFFAGGPFGAIWKSRDGRDWQQWPTGFPEAYFEVITFREGGLIAVGGKQVNGAGSPIISAVWSSSDGVSWSETSFLQGVEGGLSRAVSRNGILLGLISGGVWRSKDGTNQIQIIGDRSLRDIAFGADRFVVVGEKGTLRSSPDGENWCPDLPRTPQPRIPHLSSIAYGNDLYVGAEYSENGNTILTSKDGVEWVSRLQIRLGDAVKVRFLNSVFLVTRAEDLLISTNGIDWRIALTNWKSFGATFGNGRFVALGSDSVASSTDGVSWNLPKKIRGVIAMETFEALTFGLGVFVAVGLAGIWTSTNSVDWTLSHRDQWYNGSRSDAAYGGGHFIVVDQGSTYMSSNGLNWIHAGASPYLTRIAYGNGTFAAIGNVGAFHWSRGSIHTSPDGNVWTTRATVSPSLNDLTFANGSFVIGGAEAVLQSAPVGPRFSEPLRSKTGRFESMLLGGLGQAYGIETSTDLKTWSLLTERFTEEKFEVVPLMSPASFYRAKILGPRLSKDDRGFGD